MSKRGATSELTHENWDVEDPKDSDENMIGSFARATPEQLQNRVIRSAKRRSAQPSSSSSPSSAFTSFSGFGTKSDNTTPKPNFSSFSNLSSGVKNGHDEQEKTPVNVASSDTPKQKAKPESVTNVSNSTTSTDYYTQLRGLNIAVSNWISMHVKENPCCILTPVFKDYEKHLCNIEKLKPPEISDDTDGKPESTNKEEGEGKISDASENSSASFVGNKDPIKTSTDEIPASSVAATFSDDNNSSGETSVTKSHATISSPCLETSIDNSKTKSDNTAISPPSHQSASPPSFFQVPKVGHPSVFGSLKSTSSLFGSSTTTTTTTTEPSKSGFNPSALTFSFGSSSAAAPSNTFQFGGSSSIGSGFSFSAQVANNSQQQQEAAADDETEVEEPPKIEFQPIEEKDSVYSVKCKVFVKKDAEYKDRGVGMLYLKTTSGSKTQLLVRTATTTGQILLNTLVTSDLRPARQGKNNVQIVCIPTPNDKTPAITLIRVKTDEAADELLAKINEHIS